MARARACERFAPSLGVLLLLCLTQAASGLPRRQSTALSSSGPDAYILSQGENSFSTNLSLEAMGAARVRLSGDFLWIRRAGKVYLIRDDQTLNEAQALFAPLRQLDPEHEALARRQSRLEAEQEALDREQEKIEQELDGLADEEENGERASARRGLERRQRDLEPRLRALESKERELDQVERSIDEREDALEKKIEARLWRLIDESIERGLARPDENR
jgi:hypothetical protein